MIEFILLVAVIGGIVALSRRWPEIEAKLFGGHAPVSKPYAAEHPELASDDSAAAAASEPVPERTAGGFMEKRPLRSEPNIDPAVMSREAAAQSAPSETATASTAESEEAETEPDEPSALSDPDPVPPAPEPEPAPDPAASASADTTPEPSPGVFEEPVATTTAAEPVESPPSEPDTPTEANPEIEATGGTEQEKPEPDPARATPPPAASPEVAPKPSTPGELVTGQPARPSQPAYYDATAGGTESIADLAAEADEAYRERDYQRAEEACLKLLVKEPKNHKYMTRIGQVYQEMGNLEDAKEAFEAAKVLDPKNFFVLNRLSEVERLLNDKGGKSKTS